MKVFISWSGSPSKEIAGVLKKYLPSIVQEVETFYSPNEIIKGKTWSSDLNKELSGYDLGIICLTKNNFQSEWINYEAGIMAKAYNSKICPLLFDIQPSDITHSPLTMYQMTTINKEDMFKLFRSLNNSCEKPIIYESFIEAFERVWIEMEREFTKIRSRFGGGNINSNNITYRDYLADQLNTANQVESQSNDQLNILALMLKNNDQVTEYFEISKDHIKSSYKMSQITNGIGITLLAISVLLMIIFKNLEIAIIAGVAGTITEVITATVLRIHNKSTSQLNHYYEALHENERTLTAITLAEKMSETKRDEAFMEIIRSQIRKDNTEISKGSKENEDTP